MFIFTQLIGFFVPPIYAITTAICKNKHRKDTKMAHKHESFQVEFIVSSLQDFRLIYFITEYGALIMIAMSGRCVTEGILVSLLLIYALNQHIKRLKRN